MRKPRGALQCLLLACLVGGGSRRLAAQDVSRTRNAVGIPTVAVSRAGEAVLGEFDHVSAIRELPDGSIIVTDNVADRVFRVGWTTNRVVEIGRKGRGPGEFLEVGRVFPLRGDSSVLEDPTTRRWIAMKGSAFGASLNATARYSVDLYLAGVDTLGRYLEVSPHVFAQPRNSRPVRIRDFADTLVAVLVHAATGRRDTVAALRGSYRGHAEARKVSRGVAMNYFFYSRLRTEDQALLFPDGWLAVVRADPYSVEWRAPSRDGTVSTALPQDRVRVDDLQKRYAMFRTWDANTRDLFKPEEMPGWPQFLPPFERDALLSTPEGWIGIVRTPDARAPIGRVDIVDRAGRLRARLELPEGERVVGIGARHVYSVRADDDDVEHLIRRAWTR